MVIQIETCLSIGNPVASDLRFGFAMNLRCYEDLLLPVRESAR